MADIHIDKINFWAKHNEKLTKVFENEKKLILTCKDYFKKVVSYLLLQILIQFLEKLQENFLMD